MRAVVTRVRWARVSIAGEVVGEIARGLLVLLAVGPDDAVCDVDWMADKLASLRVFDDERGRMGKDVRDVDGAVLLVSQFTLYADVRRGRRPSFVGAAPPDVAAPLVEDMARALRARGLPVAQGRFGADMLVESANDGPVTLIVDTPEVPSGSR